jgi:UDP-N-acetylglucosamine--N-acetylmuramyl-(pentapeptide) pyrophosphoryl-undecaprenol N-acetylglucosamine transferase
MRVVVSGGGTAGHISPILAVVSQLKLLDPTVELLYVGMDGGMEARMAAASGLAFASISAGKYRRYQGLSFWQKLRHLPSQLDNARDIGRVVKGFAQARRILRDFRPDAIFLKGGYVSVPVGLAARSLGLAYVIHESDTVPGLANKVLSRWATHIAVGWPVERYSQWPHSELSYVGNPIRPALLLAHPLEGRQIFGLQEDLPVVLVVGGSGGSRAMNEVVVQALPKLLSTYYVLHVTGERDIDQVRSAVAGLAMAHPERYQAHAFLSDTMAQALSVADLVVSRAGANAIAELAALGKATILIPAPQLRDQSTNAQVLGRAEAARVIPQSRLTAQLLTDEVRRILEDLVTRSALEARIKGFAKPNAARELAEMVYQTGRGEPSSERGMRAASTDSKEGDGS